MKTISFAKNIKYHHTFISGISQDLMNFPHYFDNNLDIDIDAYGNIAV